MKIAVLTGGGDCPGLNAAIRAIVKKSEAGGDSVIGIKNGWDGLIKGNVEPLTDFSVSGILPKGGTIIGTSRTNPVKSQDLIQRCLANFKKYEFSALIAIGGEDTLGVAKNLFDLGMPVIGIPKTIDNDLTGTEYNIGFDTACNTVMEAIDKLHSTAESHHRVMVIEVMGRESGWIATIAGIAGGADYIVVPEIPYSIDEICEVLVKRKNRGKEFSIVVVAEGARPKGQDKPISHEDTVDEFGHVKLGGAANVVARDIEKRTGLETRVTILGHIQRGGSPTALDRVIATRMGLRAVDLARQGRFGRLVVVFCSQVTDIPLSEVAGRTRKVDNELIKDTKVFFG